MTDPHALAHRLNSLPQRYLADALEQSTPEDQAALLRVLGRAERLEEAHRLRDPMWGLIRKK